MASTLMLPSHPHQDEPHTPVTYPLATPPNIWQNHAFCRLWAGETVSLFGTEITVLALPLTAIIALKASAFEVGILDALAWLPYLVFALTLGVWVDHRRRRPLIILANVSRAGLLVLIPLAWIGHFLTFPLLASVAFGAGALSVIFNLTYQAYVPTILPQHQILSGNSKLQISASAAKIGGPGLAGILVQTLSAPLAIVVDALSFLIAGCSVIAIRTPEPLPVVVKQPRSLWADIHDGLRYTFSHPHLRAMTGMASTYNFAEQILLTLWIVYAIKHGITPTWLGGILAVGSGGALAGSLVAGALLRWVGIRTALRGAITTSAAGLLLIPLANGAPTSMSLLLALAFGINGAGLAALNIYLRSIRQQTVPAAMMGRVVASYTCFSMGTVPVGAFLAGTISLVIGIQGTLIAGAIVACFAIPWVWNIAVPITSQAVLSPIRPSRGNVSMKVRHAPRIIRAVPYAHPQQRSHSAYQRCGKASQPWLPHEILILWCFLKYDVTATILPALCFTLAAIPPRGSSTIVAVLHSCVYFTCFGWCFTIANQAVGIEEDRVNKPDRPLVRQLLTVQGAWVRWTFITALFVGLGIQAHILAPTILWVLIACSSAAAWDKHWWWKQLIMGLGVLVELSAAWQLAAPLSPTAARWILSLAGIVLVVIALQDLRDVAGDRLRGRRTLPLLWGDQPLRRFLTATFLLLPVGIHWLLTSSFPQTIGRTTAESFLVCTCWLIAWRLWFRRGPQPDHRTYLLFTSWYCGILASFAVLARLG